jgi:hypothetical protein
MSAARLPLLALLSPDIFESPADLDQQVFAPKTERQ